MAMGTIIGAVTVERVMETLGRLHPAVVHFPIALFIVAAGIEFCNLLRRKAPASPTAVICLVIGAIASIVAVILGLLDAHYTGMDDVATHQWLGIATAALAIVILICAIWNRPERANPIYRGGLFLAAVLVAVTGYYGGELTYGQGYLTELLWPASHGQNSAATTQADMNSDSP